MFQKPVQTQEERPVLSPFLWATEESGGKGRNRIRGGRPTGREAGKVAGRDLWGKRWKGRNEPP